MISEKIFKSKLHQEPFKYIYIEKIFNEKTIVKLINNFPDDKYFTKKKNFTKYDTKRKFLVLYDMYENYWFKSKFWRSFIEQNLNYDYKNALLEKFLPYIRKPSSKKELNFLNIRIELSKDEIGYKLDPHTDDSSRLITNLIYLNEKKSPQKKIGFNMLINKNNTRNYGGHLDDKNFKKIKTIPFGRGNMLAFLRSNNSYHSVDENNIYERKSIQIAIYYKNKS